MTRVVYMSFVSLVIVLIFSHVNCEPPPSNSGGWGQQQTSGGYSQSGTYSSGYSNSMGGYSGGQSSGGWGQQQSQPQPLQSSGGGWGQQQQPQVQSSSGGGWGQQAQPVQQSSGNGGWGNSNKNQMKGQGNGGWGPQLSLELDTANIKPENLNPAKILRNIAGIPRNIINFIRESGLYLLFIPLLIIIPLMLLAFNIGRTIGNLKWGWSRSLSTVESGIVGYLKSPVWQKIGETLMDEKVFDRIMKSIEEFKKDW